MNRIISFCLSITVFLVLHSNARAQHKVNLSTPERTIETHLENLESDNFFPELAAKTLMPGSLGKQNAETQARKLLEIFRGFGILVEYSRISNNPNYIDSTSLKHVYLISKSYPKIYLEKVGNNWYYSKETVQNIDKMHQEAYPYGSGNLLKLMPKFGSEKYLGLQLWQYAGILSLILLCVVVHRVFTWIINRIIFRFIHKRSNTEITNKYLAPVSKPLSYLVLFPILSVLVPVLQLPIGLNTKVFFLIKVSWPIFAGVAAYRFVDVLNLYFEKLAKKTESTLDDQAVPLIRKALKIFVIIVGIIAILTNLDIDIVPLLTGLSIGGLAFALAAQDTIKNLFGSVMIFLDRPFQVGDWITSSDVDGTVEEVGFRATRIRTFRNSVTYVPNAQLADSHVDNHGLRVYRRFYTTIGITYDTPTEVIEAFVQGLRTIVEKHPHTRKDYYNIYLNDFGASSLNIMFYVFFRAKTWPLELQYRHELIIEAIRLAESLGVRYAFPTQTLHVESYPGTMPMTPTYDRNPKHIQEQLDKHFHEEKKAKSIKDE